MSRVPARLSVLAITSLTAGVLTASLASTATAAPPAVGLTVDVSKYTSQTSDVQWGHIVEDISHSVEGGLNANLVRNSNMKENGSNPPSSWSLATTGGGTGSIALDTGNPVSAANRSSLELTVGSDTAGQSVGAANGGFYGVGLKKSTTYTATFWARTAGYTGPLRVNLQGLNGTVYGTARTGATSSAWTQYSVNVTTNAKTPTGSANQVVIGVPAGASGATVWLNVVQVLPPTYGTSGLLRTDLMQKMAATRPGFWRVPGGNYLEGNTFDTYFNWKNTIGPVVDRAGHQNDAWGYWSTDQAGIKSYLDMAEQTGAQPLLAVFAGYVLNNYQNGGNAVPQDQIQPYIQDALDEIQYVIGDTSTTWGAKRAADGHPAPYELHYVEIGNEDFFDGTGSYNNYRFPMFYDAIKAAYPQLQLIATAPVSNRTPDIIDEHYYNNDPAAFTAMAHKYDSYDRSGPKVLVGEYGITNGTNANPTGTLSGAIGEAGYMTGMLRNSDVVVGASYAPALADVNDFQWPTNMIGFDANTSYGSPSYYVQQMFGANKGRYVLPTTFTGVDSTISYSATRSDNGDVYVHVVNPTASAVTGLVKFTGAGAVSTRGTVTTLTGDPNARNSIAAPTTIAPTTAGFASSQRFNRTFPANSVTEFTVNVSGAVSPALTTTTPLSLRVTTPNYTDRSLAVGNGIGITAAVTSTSSTDDRKSATFYAHIGLGDSTCYSLESRLVRGQYLTVTADHHVVLATPGTTAAAKNNATWCVSVGNSGSGVSLQSKSQPGRYLRHYANVLYAAADGGPNLFDNTFSYAVDTSFLVEGGFWRSGADVTLGDHSFQPAAATSPDQYLRHYAFLGQVSTIDGSSSALDKQDASFTLVPGLADSSCYSFRSVGFPDRYLRHYDYRIRLDVGDGSTGYAQDATFCAQPGNDGTGVSWQSIGFPDHYLRNLNGDVYIASNGGTGANTSTGWAGDTSWNTVAPLAATA